MAINFGNDVSFIRDKFLFRLRVGAVIIKDDAILMVKSDLNSYYYSVGGAVKLNESLEDALHRELLEEVGQDLEIDRLIAIHQNFFQDDEIGKEHWHELSFYYLVSAPVELDLNAVQSESMTGGIEKLYWVPLDKYQSYAAYPLFFKDIKHIINSSDVRHIVTRE